MPVYTNQEGAVVGTTGADSFIYTTFPVNWATIDAGDGIDTVEINTGSTSPLMVSVEDIFNSGMFQGRVADDPYGAWIHYYEVEHVTVSGSSADDEFRLTIGSNSSALSVHLDGGGGEDHLVFDFREASGDFTFQLTETAITSSFGQISGFERFTIYAGSGDDTIQTGGANDTVWTGTGVDAISTGGGNDYIYSESSGGWIDGGDGYDSYVGNFSATSDALIIEIGTSFHSSNGITVTNVETISVGGGSGDDEFIVTSLDSAAAVYGGDGQDRLVYAVPSTTALTFQVVAYGDERDGQAGPPGNTLAFYGFESVSFTGSDFNDQFEIRVDYSATGGGIDFDGAGGSDSLSADFSHFSGATTFILAGDGTITSNRGDFANLEQFSLTGGSGDDTLYGGALSDQLRGGAGADYLSAGDGRDVLYSGDDNNGGDGAADVLIGGGGDDSFHAGYGDSVYGGAGTDDLRYYATDGTAGITADFTELTGGGTITVAGATISGIESVPVAYGTNFDDTITASIKGSSAYGPNAGSTIYGLDGNDRLSGSTGDDTLWGGKGDDILSGGAGADKLFGGEGVTSYIDTAANFDGDTITFSGGDKIIITDASLATFTFSLSGGDLLFGGRTLHIGADFVGNLVASAAAGGGVQLTVQPPPLFSYEQIADQLVNGYWGGDWHRFDVTQGGTITVSLTGLTSAAQSLARAALQEWTDVIGISFNEVSSGAQIIFDDTYGGAYTTSAWENHVISVSNINISASWLSSYGSSLNSYSFQTFLHEIGHALGLGHAGNYNETALYRDDALFLNDATSTTVMSYFGPRDNFYFRDLGFSDVYALTPMVGDIVAMQTLYGLSTTTRTGDTIYGYGTNTGSHVFDPDWYRDAGFTIVDSGGIDTLDYSGYTGSGSQLINLNPGTFSNLAGSIGNVSIAPGTIIENAIGGPGADTLIGNASANVLNGGGYADNMIGGGGDDTYVVDHSGDLVTENPSEGTDLVRASVNYTLTGNVENLSLTGTSSINGTGNSLANLLTGNDSANSLYGLAGNDKLIGYGGNDVLNGGAGLDRLIGGTGNDTYYVDDYNDKVIENAGEGTDRVFSTTNFILGANVENLTLTGAVNLWGYGNASDNVLTGNSAANKLFGEGGNDFLDGGAGSDRLFGGLGDDTYYVDSYSDRIIERAGEGTDSVFASDNALLDANVENLTLTGSASIWAYGNDLGNSLTGNSGANKLFGLAGNDTLDGGAGADRMWGGTGDDAYYVDNYNDKIVESAGEGSDSVFASTSYKLSDNVEKLSLTGSANLWGYGNGGDNVLAGNGGSNKLYGLDGDDTLRGRAGNDLLEGGAGRDVLFGESGADTFVFRDGDFAGLTASTCDQIKDFSQADGDLIRLREVDANTLAADDQDFAFIGTGAFTGTAGQLRYDQISGNTYVYGDTDGDSSADFMIRLDGSHTLTSGDFVL